MRDWGLLYQRQPAHVDAILFAVALLLHAPLVTLHLKAPQKSKGKISRFHDVGFIEEQAKKRKEKPVALPPKVNTIQDAMKKAAEIREKLQAKKAPPPPPAVPKPEVKQDLKTFDPSQIKMDTRKAIEAQMQTLKQDKAFQERNNLMGQAAAKEIKLGGTASAIQMSKRDIPAPGGGGPALKGKTGGFAVAAKAAPVGIGGGDELQMGGGPAIVLPTASRARADKSIMSSVATVKDRGSLGSGPGGGGGPGAGGGPVAAGPGIVLGTGGGNTSIAVASAARGPAMAAPPAIANTGKSFSGAAASGGSGGGLSGGGLAGGTGGGSLPSMAAAPRGAARPARSLFQITGPLKDRPIVNQVVPAYPEWAKAKGIEANVVLQFTVTPDGFVKSTILTLRTSGYPQMDQTAVDALRKWRFQPLPQDRNEDQVGTITFVFSVR